MNIIGGILIYCICGVTTVFIASVLERYTKFKFGFIDDRLHKPTLQDGAVGISFFLWWLVLFVGSIHIFWTLLNDMSIHFIKSDDPWGTKPKIKPPKIKNENGNETLVAQLRNALGPIYSVADVVQLRQKTADPKKIEKLGEIIINTSNLAMDTKGVVMDLLTEIENQLKDNA